ncbi:MAG: hypothetical protein JWL66_2517 [Sphingomonadales bacterium]|nr:hypothetical protein [Sphingomonadales bacterium]
MRHLIALRSPVAVWLLLVILTLLSYASWAEGTSADGRIAGSAVIVIAFVKARLIGLDFMEIRGAMFLLRSLFEAWVFIVCAVLVVMFWTAG